MNKEDNKVVFTKHSIYKHIAPGTVMACTYNGASFYLETKEKKKKVFINNGDRLFISPLEDKIEVYGRFGNFKDEDGIYHAGKINISPKDILVDETVVIYTEKAIIGVCDGWENFGVSCEEAEKIRNLDLDAVDTKKNYERFNMQETKENVSGVFGKCISVLKDLWS